MEEQKNSEIKNVHILQQFWDTTVGTTVSLWSAVK